MNHISLFAIHIIIFSTFEAEIRRLNVKRKHPITLILADVNGLKRVNDSRGHLRGDELLKKAAGILRRSCREDEIIVRWGGRRIRYLPPPIGHKSRPGCLRKDTE